MLLVNFTGILKVLKYAGDLMKSMNLLVYKPEEGTIENRAQTYGSAWMTAVEILDDDTFLGAENSYNLFTVRKNSDAASDEDRRRLQASKEPYPICK